jgi:proteasome accessory factor B
MYRRGDLGQVARALRVLDGLHGFRQGRTLAELAADLGVSTRTVRRDLAELVDAGFEIALTSVAGRPGARLVERSYSSVPITRRERYTLLAVASVFDVLRGTPLHDDVRSVLTKLQQRMTPDERAEHETLGSRFAYVPDGGTKAYVGKEDVIDALQTGILSRRLVRYAYSDARGRVQRGVLAPYSMLLYRHGLYIVGARMSEHGTEARSVGVFAVERFRDAEHLRGASFEVPRDFDVEDVLHGAFGIHIATPDRAQRVVVEFKKEKAALVAARQWHATQRLEKTADGGIRLEFTCTNIAPVVSWVLEWGPHARVIEPDELVAVVREELRAAVARYDE